MITRIWRGGVFGVSAAAGDGGEGGGGGGVEVAGWLVFREGGIDCEE